MSAFKPVIVTTTAPTREEAQKIGSLLLEKQLAACVQYEVITSQYLWNGEICRDDEIRITIKTSRHCYREIQKNHPRQPQLRMPANPDAKRIARIRSLFALAEAEFRFIKQPRRLKNAQASL
nr:divalent-cation tolerance protein CutA [Neisseria sicca]